MPDDRALEKLQPELFPDEKLLWHGRPIQGIHFQRSDILGLVVGLPFLVVAIFLILQFLGCIPIPQAWLTDSTVFEAKFAIGVLMVLFLALSLFLLGGGQWLNARDRRRLIYGITTQRILILRKRLFGVESLTSLRIDEVSHMSLRVDANGNGFLNFSGLPIAGQAATSSFLTMFYLIPDVRNVYALIRSIQKAQLYPI